MRLIDADALPRHIIQINDADTGEQHKLPVVFLPNIDNAPTVNAVEVVHGRWEFVNDYQSRCTACKEVSWVDHTNEPNYCPNCGAKMDGGAGDG